MKQIMLLLIFPLMLWGDQIYVQGYLDPAPLLKHQRTPGWINLVTHYLGLKKLPLEIKSLKEITFSGTPEGVRFSATGLDLTPVIPKKMKGVQKPEGIYYTLDSASTLLIKKKNQIEFGTPELINKTLPLHTQLQTEFPPQKNAFFKLAAVVPENFRNKILKEKNLPHGIKLLMKHLTKIDVTALKGEKSTLFIALHLTPAVAQELRLHLNTFHHQMKGKVNRELDLIDMRKDKIFKRRFGKKGLKLMAPLPKELKTAYNNIKIMSQEYLLTIQVDLAPDLAFLTPMVALAIGIPAFYNYKRSGDIKDLNAISPDKKREKAGTQKIKKQKK